jgi:hypothetical protein
MIVCLDETPSQHGRILHGHGRARGHVRHHGMAGVPQRYQTALTPRIERLDVQDRPLRELRSRFDHCADFRVKARKRVYDVFSGAELPRRLRVQTLLGPPKTERSQRRLIVRHSKGSSACRLYESHSPSHDGFRQSRYGRIATNSRSSSRWCRA